MFRVSDEYNTTVYTVNLRNRILKYKMNSRMYTQL